MATPVPSIPEGYAPGGDGSGIVLLRAEFADRHGEPDTLAGLFGKQIALTCTQEKSLEEYRLSPVSDGLAADFYVALPAGDYRYFEPPRGTEGDMLRFEVRPGAVECLGTIRIRHDYRPFIPHQGWDVSVHDDCEAIVQRFRASHPEVTKGIEKGIFRRYTYDWYARGWVPNPQGRNSYGHEALEHLEEDHDFLLKGDVFAQEAIEAWVDYKREAEIAPLALRPHPNEFELYFDM